MSESEEKGVTILDAVRRAKEVSKILCQSTLNTWPRDTVECYVVHCKSRYNCVVVVRGVPIQKIHL